MFLALILYTVP